MRIHRHSCHLEVILIYNPTGGEVFLDAALCFLSRPRAFVVHMYSAFDLRINLRFDPLFLINASATDS